MDLKASTISVRAPGLVLAHSPVFALFGESWKVTYGVAVLMAILAAACSTLGLDAASDTGTPGNTSKMKPGDVGEVEIEGIGVSRNTVEARH